MILKCCQIYLKGWNYVVLYIVALETRGGCAADCFTSLLRTVDLCMSVSIQEGLAVPITAINNWLVLQKIMCSAYIIKCYHEV